MKIAVIGAGPSGLVTIKELLEHGHEVVCYEKADDIGGLFRFDTTGVSVYESTLMTSSAYISCFSDFPPPDKAPLFFRQTEYFEYLKRYTEHFQLRPCIRFKQEVKSVRRDSHGKWTVKAWSQSAQQLTEDIFDAVAVCSGVHQNPVIPAFPGKESFKGSIMHSGVYKNPSIYKDKNVVIVGAGESASDITKEVAQVTKSCFLSLRRGAFIIQRHIFNYPSDHYTDRILYVAPLWLFRATSPQERVWLRAIIFILSLPFLFLMAYIIGWGLIIFLNLYLWMLSKYLLVTLIFSVILIVYVVLGCIKLSKSALPFETLKVMADITKKSGVGVAEQFATKSEGLAVAISSGKCTLKPAISELTENGVKFADGSFVEADHILLCTGFKMEAPFLEMAESDLRKYYKHCFSPDLGKSIGFIGFVRPAIGAIPPMAEMQARWFAGLISGEYNFPDKEEMKKQIEEDSQFHRTNFRVVSDRMSYLADFTSYMDEIAGLMGCKPKFNQLIQNPFLMWKVYTSPFAGYQFRLCGPHAKREIAIKTMKRAPAVTIKFIGHMGLLIVFMISSILYKMNFKKFKPHLNFK